MAANELTQSTETRNGKLICAALFIIALIIAVWIRFDQIDIKPFHHDEGVNSYFLLNLANTGQYQYNPENFHGPTLYYFALVAMRAFGRNDFALRFTPALFGVLTVLLLWPLRRHLGIVGTPAAAFFLALSPGLVYYSRDFIHEMSFGCFAMGIVVGAWRYAESKHFFWLALMAASIGLMIATKETVVINLAVLVVAMVLAAIWDLTRNLMHDRRFTPANLVRELKRAAAGTKPSLDHLLAAIIIVVFIHIFFYSSLFTHWQGVTDFFRSILLWAKDRSNQDHVHPSYYYLGILLKLELPLVAGALLGGLIVLLKGSRFWLFAAAWTIGTILAYSIIPYKTPWLMVSFLIPMAIMCGYAVEQIYQLFPVISIRVLWIGLLISCLTFCGQLARQVNFEKHDDNSNSSGYLTDLGKRLNLKPYLDGQYGYVYAQTDRDFLYLVEAIKKHAERFPSSNHTGIYIATPEYWPLPWYLRDFDKVAFVGSLPAGDPPRISQPIILASENQRSELDKLSDFHASTQSFVLRPGVSLLLYSHDEEPKQ